MQREEETVPRTPSTFYQRGDDPQTENSSAPPRTQPALHPRPRCKATCQKPAGQQRCALHPAWTATLSTSLPPSVAGNSAWAEQKRMENRGCNTRCPFFTFLSLQLFFFNKAFLQPSFAVYQQCLNV